MTRVTEESLGNDISVFVVILFTVLCKHLPGRAEADESNSNSN
jgi:hypothetical protein